MAASEHFSIGRGMEHKAYTRAISGAQAQIVIRFQTPDTDLWSHQPFASSLLQAGVRTIAERNPVTASILQFAWRRVAEALNFRVFAALRPGMGCASCPGGGLHDRSPAGAGYRRLLRPVLGLRAALREALMNLEYAIGLALSVLMLVYLAYALVKPERF